MNKIEIAETLQLAHNKYFDLLMKSYPTLRSEGLLADFGPPEMCDLAIEVHSCAIALGNAALARLNHIGLSTLYPFDNPIDLYNWRVHVKSSRIDHTTYASIAIRIDSELKRLLRTFEIGGQSAYDELPSHLFLVSMERYASLTTQVHSNVKPSSEQRSHVQIGTLNITNAVDSAAVSRLEELEKKTTVWSNFSNIINTLRQLFGG